METEGDLDGYLDEFVDLTDQFFVWLNDLPRPEPGSDFAVDAEHDQLPVFDLHPDSVGTVVRRRPFDGAAAAHAR